MITISWNSQQTTMVPKRLSVICYGSHEDNFNSKTKTELGFKIN